MWSEISRLFREYMGSGLIVLWFLLSALYLLIREKRKHIRVLFLYIPLILLVLFFNPLFIKVVGRFVGVDIYYRILWLIPFTVIISYTAIEIYGQLKGRKKGIFLVVTAGMLMASGSYIYSSPLFEKAENIYHMPQSVVDICDSIEVEGREVRAVFPSELIQYVRQYSAVVCMPYGREILVEQWGNQDALFDLMEAGEIDARELTGQARARECHYIVLGEEKEVVGDFADYEYEEFGRLDGYVIYKDSTVTLEYR